MRLARPRFTIRLLMILIAIAGVSLAAAIMGSRLTRRAERFRQNARLLLALERNTRRALDMQLQIADSHKYVRDMNVKSLRDAGHSQPWRGASQYDRTVAEIEQQAEVSREFVHYYSQLKQKYERAAFRPWEPVAPDPPMPSTPIRPF
jgi:hypothetical protein